MSRRTLCKYINIIELGNTHTFNMPKLLDIYNIYDLSKTDKDTFTFIYKIKAFLAEYIHNTQYNI